jgi:PAS domain S-box-containing protein
MRPEGAPSPLLKANKPLVDRSSNRAIDVMNAEKTDDTLALTPQPEPLPTAAWRHEAVLVLDQAGRIVDWNAAATSLFGLRREEVLGCEVATLLVRAEHSEELRRRWGNLLAATAGEPGTERTFDAFTVLARGEDVPVSGRVIRIGAEPPHFVFAIRDISGREPTEQEHRHLQAVVDHAEDAVATVAADGTIRSWNAAAERLYGWTAAEIVGTEFGQRIAPESRAHEPAEWMAAIRGGQVVERETSRVRRDGQIIWVRVRMLPVRDDEGAVTGAVWIARDVTDHHRLAAREDLDEEARRCGEEISRALDQDLFLFAAQPIVALDGGRLDHHELLLRMRGADGELVLPGRFLPQAERSGQIVAIDSWAIEQGIRLAARAPVAINLSGPSIARGGLIDEIERKLAAADVDPRRVTFEITETAAAEDIGRAAELTRRLGDLGCGIALDDFGTGFGTFTYLSRLAVTELKIDRAFVGRVRDSDSDRRVVASMIAVAQSFGMSTVAEGIEDAETLRTLIEMGVELGRDSCSAAPP